MNELLIRMPWKKNAKTGNISMTWEQWNSLMAGEYTHLKAILLRDETVVVNCEIESWMIDCARGFEEFVLMPYSKGSPLYRYR